uniref:Secreted protein n=2 Tax=Bursaphelenchus xylophilus TaxID=6326 RepID=A0A1I7SQ35_BURXY
MFRSALKFFFFFMLVLAVMGNRAKRAEAPAFLQADSLNEIPESEASGEAPSDSTFLRDEGRLEGSGAEIEASGQE